MITKENNTPENLSTLMIQGKISIHTYYFRLKANELNINTYQLNK